MQYINLVILFASLSCLFACNTIEGLGKDIKRGGAVIENTAAQGKNDNNTSAPVRTTTPAPASGTVEKTNR